MYLYVFIIYFKINKNKTNSENQKNPLKIKTHFIQCDGATISEASTSKFTVTAGA